MTPTEIAPKHPSGGRQLVSKPPHFISLTPRTKMTPMKPQNELVSNVGVKQYIAFLKTGQKIKKAPGFVKKPGENLARSTEKDITGFSENPLVTRLFRTFYILFCIRPLWSEVFLALSIANRKRYHLNSSKEILRFDRSSSPSK